MKSVPKTAPVKLIYVAPGTFVMGSSPEEPDRQGDEGRRETSLTRAYWMTADEVTQGWFAQLTNSNPSSHSGCEHCPVERVTWYEACNFANLASEAEGLRPAYRIEGPLVRWDRSANGYRLPTEAEWEYAARSGQGFRYAGSNEIGEVGWTKGAASASQIVRGKSPNAWGFYDMSGNVYEWVWDWHPCSGNQACTRGYPPEAIDPTGWATGKERVYRGGDWKHEPKSSRVANRGYEPPENRNPGVGFRLAKNAE